MITSNNHRFLLERLLALALFVGCGSLIGYSCYQDYRQIESMQRESLNRHLLVLEKALVPQLESVDRALQGIANGIWAGKLDVASPPALGDRMVLLTGTLSGVATMLLTDTTDHIVASSAVKGVGPVSITLSRPARKADGTFVGMLRAELDPAPIAGLLEAMRITPDTRLALLSGKGEVIAAGMAGNTVEGAQEMRVVRSIQSAGLELGEPLTLWVSRDMDAIHASWRQQYLSIAWLFGGLSVLALVTLLLHQRRQQAFARLMHLRKQKLKASEAKLQSLFDATPDALLICDERGTIRMANRQVQRLLGYSVEEIIGGAIDQLIPNADRSGHMTMLARFVSAPGARPMSPGRAVTAQRKDGSKFPVEISLSRIETDEELLLACSLRDITERKAAQDRLMELAFYDQLTGLPNRTLLVDHLQKAMIACSRSGARAALLFIDMDDFKTLKHTLGHDIGRLMLKTVAQRLSDCVHQSDTVARLGGDEFMVVLGDLSSDRVEALRCVEDIAASMLAVLAQPYVLGDLHHHGSASIGITLFHGHTGTIDDLMKQADLAMYRAKRDGRNVARFFEPDMELVVKQRLAMEKDLRDAVAATQFILHFQAQVTELGHVSGAEVLLRWMHPQRGMVSPAEFIPVAEETGVILPLGQWVLETACRQLAAWARQPAMSHLTLAVNVSAHQFSQPDYVDQVQATLRQTGASPARLKLELTESLMVGNMPDIIEKMNRIKALGVGFSLDDFGTGYSSLSYLNCMPLDQLKIDQSFVRNVLISPNDAAIARTIIALARSLHLDVIAEGVETGAQRDFLVTAGCKAYQGYFFGRPLPLVAFEAMLQADLQCTSQ